MSRIIFIEPKSSNLHIFSQFRLPRLGSFILGTLMKQRGWQVEVVVEEVQCLNYNSLRGADLVGISTITATAPRAYAIADKVRQLGIPVLMGGPHVTFLVDEALQHSDYVIRGEGERALMAFIDAWEKDRHFENVPNLSYFKEGEIVHNPMDNRRTDLEQIPFPDFSLLQSKIPRIAGRRVIPIQTSRGCPFDCSFCSVTGMFGRKYRYRSTENILRELRQYNDPKNFIFFYDDNFTANRSRAKALLKQMTAEKFRFQWSTQVRVDLARDLELVQLMKKAGCHTVFIGFESVNPASLEAMNKEQSVAEMISAIKVLQQHRIHIHGMFVYGFDEDDWRTVKATVKFAKRAKLTSTQFLILTPLPGSKFYNEISKQNRIKFSDWTLYDAHHVVYQPNRFSLHDLQRAQLFSHKAFYSLREMFKKLLCFKWVDVGLAHYARRLNSLWQERNKTFLKVIELLTPKKDARIKIDYVQQIVLEDERTALDC